MLLGGTVAGKRESPAQWEELLIKSRFKAVTAPFTCETPREEMDAFCAIAERNGVLIAEVGVWKNLLDPDPQRAARNLAFAKAQLVLAEERGVPCCVNIAGTVSSVAWDAADHPPLSACGRAGTAGAHADL